MRMLARTGWGACFRSSSDQQPPHRDPATQLARGGLALPSWPPPSSLPPPREVEENSWSWAGTSRLCQESAKILFQHFMFDNKITQKQHELDESLEKTSVLVWVPLAADPETKMGANS